MDPDPDVDLRDCRAFYAAKAAERAAGRFVGIERNVGTGFHVPAAPALRWDIVRAISRAIYRRVPGTSDAEALAPIRDVVGRATRREIEIAFRLAGGEELAEEPEGWLGGNSPGMWQGAKARVIRKYEPFS
jgi:hypothetical protein